MHEQQSTASMAEADPSKPLIRLVTRNDFAVARSSVLDAFAELELAINHRLAIGGSKPNFTAPLGQKLGKIANALPTATIEECLELTTLRAAIVHSKLRILPDAPSCAIYMNTTLRMDDFPMALALTIEQHAKLAANARRVAGEIKRAPLESNPNPPSPLQPSPGAADGP
jgi:hypothetical protein